MQDGGSAFPVGCGEHIIGDEKACGCASGMALRDYFAGQALTGLLANMPYLIATRKSAVREKISASSLLAHCCYEFADDMLKAKEIKN